MAVNIKDDGSLEIIYGQKWTGLNVQMPANLIADTDAAMMTNFMLRNKELRCRYILTAMCASISTTSAITGVGSFLSPAQAYHTFAFDDAGNLRNFNTAGPNTFDIVANLPHFIGPNAVKWRVFDSILYFVNGTQTVCSWDGTVAGAAQDVVLVDGGATAVGAKYIDVLAQHVLLANTTGNASDGPFTLRWSAVGLPTVFDPTVNVNAGFNIFIDFADEISGIMTLGRVGYIFHRTGITEIAPTGVGTAPFDFNHIWNAQDGMGNVYPYTIAQYGSMGAFVSTENVYMVQNYQFQPIGGNARDAILADLAAAGLGLNSTIPLATIVPGYASDFAFPALQIYIPNLGSNFTVVWEYSTEDQFWERYMMTGRIVKGIPEFCVFQS